MIYLVHTESTCTLPLSPNRLSSLLSVINKRNLPHRHSRGNSIRRSRYLSMHRGQMDDILLKVHTQMHRQPVRACNRYKDNTGRATASWMVGCHPRQTTRQIMDRGSILYIRADVSHLPCRSHSHSISVHSTSFLLSSRHFM